jgi:hypothetical protein
MDGGEGVDVWKAGFVRGVLDAVRPAKPEAVVI